MPGHLFLCAGIPYSGVQMAFPLCCICPSSPVESHSQQCLCTHMHICMYMCKALAAAVSGRRQPTSRLFLRSPLARLLWSAPMFFVLSVRILNAKLSVDVCVLLRCSWESPWACLVRKLPFLFQYGDMSHACRYPSVGLWVSNMLQFILVCLPFSPC